MTHGFHWPMYLRLLLQQLLSYLWRSGGRDHSSHVVLPHRPHGPSRRRDSSEIEAVAAAARLLAQRRIGLTSPTVFETQSRLSHFPAAIPCILPLRQREESSQWTQLRKQHQRRKRRQIPIP